MRLDSPFIACLIINCQPTLVTSQYFVLKPSLTQNTKRCSLSYDNPRRSGEKAINIAPLSLAPPPQFGVLVILVLDEQFHGLAPPRQGPPLYVNVSRCPWPSSMHTHNRRRKKLPLLSCLQHPLGKEEEAEGES